MTNFEDQPPPAVGAYWIKEEDYPALLKIFDDGVKMPRTWKEWLKIAEEMERGLKAYGHVVMRDGACTAIVLMHKMKDGTFVIEGIVRGRWAALDRETLIKRMAEDCRNDLSRIGVGFKVVVEQEPGSGGKESAEATIRNLAGFNVVADKPGAGRSKEVRAEPLACAVQAGSIFLHAGTWVPDFLEECGNWPQGTKDQVDAAAQAFFHLTGGKKGSDLATWIAAFG